MSQTMIYLALCFSISLLLIGCQEPDRAQHLPTVKMQIGSKQFTLEVADEDREQEMGLMFRDSMPPDHGMIFIFDDVEVRGFWMKNTRIPLDIIYLGPDQVVVSIKPMEPFDLRNVSSERPAQYAIELNKGQAAASGVKVGDQLTIPAPPKDGAATTRSR